MAVNLSTSPWWADFLRLALANVVANLMVPLAGLVDTAFLGHLAEIHHLGGVALATVVFNVIYWGFGFLRMGTTGITAQALGQSKEDEVVRVLKLVLWLRVGYRPSDRLFLIWGHSHLLGTGWRRHWNHFSFNMRTTSSMGSLTSQVP
jgi:Na+-driven multidrug efflux pump